MGDFAERLRGEIGAGQARRASFVKQKFAYVIGAMAVGNVASSSVGTAKLLYLAPVIAFAFDLYIAGEDYGIKRAGAFLSATGSGASIAEQAWEQRLRGGDKKGERKSWLPQLSGAPFVVIAGPLLSFVVLGGAIMGLRPAYGSTAAFGGWIALNAGLILGVTVASVIYNQRLRTFADPIAPNEKDPHPPTPKG